MTPRLPPRDSRFEGRIAGLGTASGIRFVIGMWEVSPFGRFADVMVETADGQRTFLAPSEEIATYVGATYTFDAVRIVPVDWTRTGDLLEVTAGALSLRLEIGAVSPLGRLLAAVPGAIATRPAWLRLIDLPARILAPGSRTAGSAGAGRTEFYGVTAARRIAAARVRDDGHDLGRLTPLLPPVRFGFGSAPAVPHLVDVVTTIREAAAPPSERASG